MQSSFWFHYLKLTLNHICALFHFYLELPPLLIFYFFFLRLSLLTTHPCRTKVRNLFMVNWGRRGGGAQRPAQVFVESINRNQIVMEFSLVWGSMYIIEVKVRKCTVKWTRPRPSSAHIRVFMILDFSLLIKFSIAVSRYLWICLTSTHQKNATRLMVCRIMYFIHPIMLHLTNKM